MKIFKLKLDKYITNLDIYLAKSNISSTPVKRKLFSKGYHIYNMTSKIPEYENDETGEKFIKDLITLYTYEKNKPSNYYEKYPEKIYTIVTMSYFSLMFFIMNKNIFKTNFFFTCSTCNSLFIIFWFWNN